jgi:hypothetical protein
MMDIREAVTSAAPKEPRLTGVLRPGEGIVDADLLPPSS